MTVLDARAGTEALRSGGLVVLMESNEAESEGSLIAAAQFASPDSLREFSSRAIGPLYVCLTDARCAQLGLASDPSSDGPWQPGSIALRGLASASSSRDDHARTIQALLDPGRGADDFERIGYVHPVRARPGGVLQRAGRAEAAVDLVRLAGCQPAALLSMARTDDGDFARGDGLRALAGRNGFPVVTVGEVIALRRQTDKLVERIATARLPTKLGVFSVVGFRGVLTETNHLALVRGNVDGAENVLVRVHTECIVGDVFQALSCTCARDLERALRVIGREELGVLVYVVPDEDVQRFSRHEDIEGGLRPPPMDEYGVGAQILADLGLSSIRILTDHPKSSITGLDGFGLEIVEQVPLTAAGTDSA